MRSCGDLKRERKALFNIRHCREKLLCVISEYVYRTFILRWADGLGGRPSIKLGGQCLEQARVMCFGDSHLEMGTKNYCFPLFLLVYGNYFSVINKLRGCIVGFTGI